jgi:porin-like protein
MKMVKSLLLGSAAGLVAVAGAQAADLPVKAKPVQYVKICTLYGDGFYYIPGSETCLKIAGYVRADYGYNVDTNIVHVYGINGAQDRSRDRIDDEDAEGLRRNAFTTRHRANLNADSRTQTQYGTLRTYWSLHFENEVDAGNINVAGLTVQRAFIQWAGFTLGRTSSFVDPAGQLGDSGLRSLHQIQTESTTGASGINQIAYTWQLGNGVTLNIGADEERVRGIYNTDDAGAPRPGSNLTPASNGRIGQHMPSPWVSLRVNQAWGAASVAVIAQPMRVEYYTDAPGCPAGAQPGSTQCDYPDNEWGWGILTGAEFKLPFIAPGDRVAFHANYAVGAVRFAANNLNTLALFGSKPKGGNNVAFGWVTDGVYNNSSDIEKTTAWSFGAGFEHYWSRQFSTTWYGSYAKMKYNNDVIDSGEFCRGASGGGVTPLDGQRCNPGFAYWAVGSHSDWFPVPGFRLAVDVLYTQVNTAMKGAVFLGNAQGNRPSGVYTARNLGITSVIFRAQRAWGGGD